MIFYIQCIVASNRRHHYTSRTNRQSYHHLGLWCLIICSQGLLCVLNAPQNLKNCFHQMTLRKKLSLFNVFVKYMRTGNRHTDGFFYFKVKDSTGLESKGQPKFTCVRWNPHHNCTQVATANDSCIRGWDLRSMQWVFMFKARITLLSLNFNRGFDTYTCNFSKLILNLIHVFLQRKGIPFICFS